MDFDMEWSLGGARYVTQKEYKEVTEHPENYEAARKLAEHNIAYGYSCEVMNKYCMQELSDYRSSIVDKKPKEEQDSLLDKLHKKYERELKKHPQPIKK